jgi:hypothetical protein
MPQKLREREDYELMNTLFKDDQMISCFIVLDANVARKPELFDGFMG